MQLQNGGLLLQHVFRFTVGSLGCLASLAGSRQMLYTTDYVSNEYESPSSSKTMSDVPPTLYLPTLASVTLSTSTAVLVSQ